jgi:hypothetical protein
VEWAAVEWAVAAEWVAAAAEWVAAAAEWVAAAVEWAVAAVVEWVAAVAVAIAAASDPSLVASGYLIKGRLGEAAFFLFVRMSATGTAKPPAMRKTGGFAYCVELNKEEARAGSTRKV